MLYIIIKVIKLYKRNYIKEIKFYMDDSRIKWMHCEKNEYIYEILIKIIEI